MSRNLSGSEKRKLKAIELKKANETAKKMKPLSVYWTASTAGGSRGNTTPPNPSTDDCVTVIATTSVRVKVAEFEPESSSAITDPG